MKHAKCSWKLKEEVSSAETMQFIINWFSTVTGNFRVTYDLQIQCMWCILCKCWYYVTHQGDGLPQAACQSPAQKRLNKSDKDKFVPKKHRHPKSLVIFESTGLAVKQHYRWYDPSLSSVLNIANIKKRLAEYNILDVFLEAASTGDLQKDLHSILTSYTVDICWKRWCWLIFKHKKDITITQQNRIILSNVDIPNDVLPTFSQLRNITLL